MHIGLTRSFLYALSGLSVFAAFAVLRWGLEGASDVAVEAHDSKMQPRRQSQPTPPLVELAGREAASSTAAPTDTDWAWTERNFQGPLFDPPPPPPPRPAPPPPPPSPPPLVLRGTVAEAGQESRAFLAGRDGNLSVLRIGEELEAAELLSVGDDHVVVRFGEHEHRLELSP